MDEQQLLERISLYVAKVTPYFFNPLTPFPRSEEGSGGKERLRRALIPLDAISQIAVDSVATNRVSLEKRR